MLEKRNLAFGTEAREKMLSGIDRLASAVSQTMGAKGRNVMFERSHNRPPIITNDGVTIAKEIILEDAFENLGCNAVKQAAERTNDVAGDGTTCSIVLAVAMIKEALKVVEEGANPIMVREGMKKRAEEVIKALQEVAIKIDSEQMVKNVATISVQDEKIGDLIGEVMFKVGKEGAVTVDDGFEEGIHYEHLEGMKLDVGSEIRAMQEGKTETIFRQAPVIISKDPINETEELLPIMDKLVKLNRKEIIIIADGYSPRVLRFILQNFQQKKFLPIVLRAPSYGDRRKEILEDLSIFLNGKEPFEKDKGINLKDALPEQLPICSTVKANKDQAIFITEQKRTDVFLDHLDKLKKMKEEAIAEYDKVVLGQRIASLKGGVASIKVNAPTQTDTEELKFRIEDAVNASRVAMEDGVLLGGGVALMNIIFEFITQPLQDGDMGKGFKVIDNVMRKPFEQIIENAALDPAKVLKDIRESKFKNAGFDVKNGKVVDMLEAGIIDPVKVISCAVKNAASIASQFITTECAITVIPKEEGK